MFLKSTIFTSEKFWFFLRKKSLIFFQNMDFRRFFQPISSKYEWREKIPLLAGQLVMEFVWLQSRSKKNIF